jgi:hypothetical protein
MSALSPEEHAKEAERLLRVAEDMTRLSSQRESTLAAAMALTLTEANVHATLAVYGRLTEAEAQR